MNKRRRRILQMSGAAIASSLGGCLESLKEGDVQMKPDTGYNPDTIETSYSEVAGQEAEYFGDYLVVDNVSLQDAIMEESSFTGHDLRIQEGQTGYTEPINIYGLREDGLNLNIFEFTDEPKLKEFLERDEAEEVELEGNGSKMTVTTNDMTNAGNYGILLREINF